MNASKDLSLAHLVVLACLAIFGLVIVFIIGIVILPIVGAAAGGYYWFRHNQMQKLRVVLPATEYKVSSSASAQAAGALSPHYDPEKFAEKLHGKVLAYVEKDTGRISCKALSDAFTDVVTELDANESFHESPTTPDSQDLISRAAHQDKLEVWRKKTADSTAYDLFLEVATGAYMELRDYFPPSAFGEVSAISLTTPISIAMEPDQVTSLAAWFFQKNVLENNLFESLRDQILTNDIATETAKDKATFDA